MATASPQLRRQSQRVRSPSPGLALLDPRCGDDDFCLEGAGFEELLRTFGAGLDVPTPPATTPAASSPPASPRGDLALALAPQLQHRHAPDVAALRCLDETHAAGPPGTCACTPAPEEGEEALYELVGDSGKKNGEKRLRSQLSRTPEWRSLAERERLARVCEAAGPLRAALAQTLRIRHCTLLRKGDLLFLARTWGYRSDIWGHRKDRRGLGRGAPLEAASITAVVPRDAAVALSAAPPLDRFAAARPEAQLAEVRAALAGPLRALAERGIEGFASFEHHCHRLAQLSHREGGAARLRAFGRTAFALVEVATRHKGGALAEINRLQAVLQTQHADVQLRMLRLDGAQAGRPAFLELAAEVEAPWEPLFRDMARLCNSAIASCSNKSALATISAPGEEPSEQTCAEAAALDALAVGCDSGGVMRGGELSLELLTHVRGVLHRMRLAPMETYLAAAAAVLSLLLGHMAGCADAMAEQCRWTAAAREALNAAHAQADAGGSAVEL